MYSEINTMKKYLRLWIQKYRRREFWPGYLFDIPVYAYFLYLAAKAKHLGFFSNVNPGMKLSGFAGYGKHEDIDKFDPKLLPISIVIKEGEIYEHIEHKMKEHNISYPCIAKPTLGRTGRDVKKIHNTKQLKTYLKRVHEDILIQEFIHDALEF
jgi:carbamoylphosphate synthase large subunit